MGNLGERIYLGDTHIDGSIIKLWKFRKLIAAVLTGWICLRIGVFAGISECRNEPSVSLK